jgi:hypothetical protein
MRREAPVRFLGGGGTEMCRCYPTPVTQNQYLILLFESLEADADDIQVAKRLSYWG